MKFSQQIAQCIGSHVDRSIQIEPVDAITLISSLSTENQSVCLFDDDNPANPIAEPMMPIEYQLAGGAVGNPILISYRANSGPIQNGLPPGLGIH